jgi:hypothetical protein
MLDISVELQTRGVLCSEYATRFTYVSTPTHMEEYIYNFRQWITTLHTISYGEGR